jgi:hypothetical protein
MRKKLDENGLVLKWPAPFRNGLKFTYHDLGILDVIIEGNTEITAKDFKQMKKFGYIFDGICLQDKDDVLPFSLTVVAFRRYKAPPLENGGKSDKKVLKKTKPRTQIGVPSNDSVCNDSSISPDRHQGDDKSR